MLDVPENLCVPLLTVTPPNAAAADILLTPSPPKKIDRRAAAAGQNHPERRRRNTDVGAGLYLKLISFTNAFLHSLSGSFWTAFTDLNSLTLTCHGTAIKHPVSDRVKCRQL